MILLNKKNRVNETQNNKTKKINKSIGLNFENKITKIFNEKDYNNESGMMTYVWGPPLWFFLHTMSFNYPINPSNQDKKNYKEFVYNLRNILPCKYCRINLKKNLKEKPLTNKHLKGREQFSRFIYDLHNEVNKMLDKKIQITYEEVRDKYENFRARCSDKSLNKNDKIFSRKIINKKGCTEPVLGIKSKCVLRIVPKENRTETLKVSNECYKKKIKTLKNKN